MKTGYFSLSSRFLMMHLAVQVMIVASPWFCSGAAFVVNSTGDEPDFNHADGIADIGMKGPDGRTIPSGITTLRAAIEQANTTPELDEISFLINGFEANPDGIFTIQTGGYSAYEPIMINGFANAMGTTNAPGIELVGGGLNLNKNSLVEGLVVGNLYLSGRSNTVRLCYIGTSRDGRQLAEKPAINSGLYLREAAHCIIQSNIIARGFTAFSIGLEVWGDATGCRIEGNFIGTDVTGQAVLGNLVGIQASANNLTIGGGNDGARNIIAGCSNAGILILDKTNVVIEGNYIGVGDDGQTALPNGDGIRITGTQGGYRIGGYVPGQGNLISGNRTNGILLMPRPFERSVTNITIQGNSIGTDAMGLSAVSNAVGIFVGASVRHTRIGGLELMAGNVISGNQGVGVLIQSGPTLVQGNLIGVLPGNYAPLGNGSHGIEVQGVTTEFDVVGTNTLIGGVEAGAGNRIAHNQGAGISHRLTAHADYYLGNSIYANGLLGIDHWNRSSGAPDGPTRNFGPGSGYTQNYPVLTNLARDAQGVITAVEGYLRSPSDYYRLEFFRSDAADPSGYGEGQYFLGALSNVRTLSDGYAHFSFPLPAGLGQSPILTATATGLLHDWITSEFSPVFQPQEMGVLHVRVEPPEAELAGCKVDPKQAGPAPLGSKIQVNAIPTNQWAFLRWQGALSGTNPVSEVTLTSPSNMVTAVFVRTALTLTHRSEKKLLCPHPPEISQEITMLDLEISVNETAEWTVDTLKFQASGSGGREQVDIQEVRLYRMEGSNRTLLGKGQFDQDNGQLAFPMYQVISAGGTWVGQLAYLLNKDEASQGVMPKVFEVRPAQIVARPTNPPLSNSEILSVERDSGPLTVAPVQNTKSLEGFGTIQAAIDAPNTVDYDTIRVCPGIYQENVKVTKALVLIGHQGPYATFVSALNPDDHAIEIWERQTSVQGFSISGVSGAERAGVAITGNVIRAGEYHSESEVANNSISGNYYGVLVRQTTNWTVSNNCIQANKSDGIMVTNAAETQIECNQITLNGGAGIRLAGLLTQDTVIDSNQIGIDTEQDTVLPNQYGIVVSAASRNWIGTGSQNVVSGNRLDGIHLCDGAWGNSIVHNMIGVDANGLRDVPNQGHGIVIINSPSNRIGVLSVDRMEWANVISGNASNGIAIIGSASSGNQIALNNIGLDADGEVPVPNGLHGVEIDGATGNVVGQSNGCCLISGNKLDGIYIHGERARDNVIQNCRIGLNDNRERIGNSNGIVIAEATWTIIGGTNRNFNVIGGNKYAGIIIKSDYNRVAGNYIGIDPLLPDARFNGGVGLLLTSSARSNWIGGLTLGERNVISGNSGAGIEIQGSYNVVHNNFVGTSVDGTAICFNLEGIVIKGGYGNHVGGPDPRAANLISGNTGHGITLMGAAAYNRIQGNFIGVARDGMQRLPNTGFGVWIGGLSYDNLIGGESANEGNQIGYNGRDGIYVGSDGTQGSIPNEARGTGNAILSNAIFQNGGLGIDLNETGYPGVTPNDPLDADSGANDLQNYPSLTNVQSKPVTGTVIEGVLRSKPLTRYRLQFFASPVSDPSGYGEGDTLIGNKWVKTDSRGFTYFVVGSLDAVTVGRVVTATATDPKGNTSEFSAAVKVDLATDSDFDGVEDLMEFAGPNQGDGNRDGVPDAEQKYVVTRMTELGSPVTLVSPETTVFNRVESPSNPSPATTPSGYSFPLGFLDFTLAGLTSTDPVRVDLILPPGVKIDRYYKYGPTPDNPFPHWYPFDYDGKTGAIIEADRIIVHLVDGGRGDDDLQVNQSIRDIGGPAVIWPLRWIEVRRGPDQTIELWLQGQTGKSYSIEFSDNLYSWQEWLRTNAPAEQFFLFEPVTAAPRQRFYRALEKVMEP